MWKRKIPKQKIRATLQIIAKILVGTLGPYGTTTIIQDREMKHFATKDGYDLMNKISFNEEVSYCVGYGSSSCKFTSIICW